MEKCPHVEKLTVSKDLSLLDPSKWLCSVCGTTEWVWACLSCAHVACGRLNEKHAVHHYEATKHHIAIEINEKYVYCYTCDDYIVEDNRYGDLEAIRSALTAIGTMSFEGVGRKGGNLLRSFSHQQEISYSHTDEDDRMITAQIHYRKSVLDKVFSAWLGYVQKVKKEKKAKEEEAELSPKEGLGHSAPPPMVTRSRSGLFQSKKRTLIPGVTGLRNLGNTCYINSIIQSLGHMEDFREYFCQLVFDLFSPGSHAPLTSSSSFSPNKGPLAAARQLLRLNTVDYYQHLNTVPTKSPPGVSKGKKGGGKGQKSPLAAGGQSQKAGGLNGGRADPTTEPGDVHVDGAVSSQELRKAKADALNALSLCQELHGLLRVLWSGKWAQVSPHGFLHAVWRAIPVFKGHAQHDAQEFLCELLDKLSQEIEDLPQCKGSNNIVDHSFRGELVSQVTCLSCKNTSRRYEPFLDLSLEFPPLFQQTTSPSMRKMCHLTEMLYKFTEHEELEPKSYSCEKCNSKRRRRSSRKETSLKTDASKQLLISKPPEILRLHLKRFRWCGRNNREKINTHVAFDNVIDISPFCLDTGTHIPQYRLQAVVVHHGAGFRAGHYTCYTYNNDAGSWVHCNDSRVNLVPEEEVLLSQAYILFYTREIPQVDLSDMPTLSRESTMCLSNQSTISAMPDLDTGSLATLRRLSRGETEQMVDDDVSISFQRDPTLIRRFTSVHSESDLKRAATLDFSGGSSSSPSSCKKRKRWNDVKEETNTQRYSLLSSSSRSDFNLNQNASAALSLSESTSSVHTLKRSATRTSPNPPEKGNSNANANTQRLSSLSPDLGMRRASSWSPQLKPLSTPGSTSNDLRVNRDRDKSSANNSQPRCSEHDDFRPLSPGGKTNQSFCNENGKSGSSSILPDVKSEMNTVLGGSESLSSLSRKILQTLRTAQATKNLQTSTSSASPDLKREATVDWSTQSRLLPIDKNKSPEKSLNINSSRGQQSSTHMNTKTELSFPELNNPQPASSPGTLSKKWTPEKDKTSLRVQHSPVSFYSLNKKGSSPTHRVGIASSPPSKSTTKAVVEHPDPSAQLAQLKREATFLLNSDSAPFHNLTVQSLSPEKLGSSSSPRKEASSSYLDHNSPSRSGDSRRLDKGGSNNSPKRHSPTRAASKLPASLYANNNPGNISIQISSPIKLRLSPQRHSSIPVTFDQQDISSPGNNKVIRSPAVSETASCSNSHSPKRLSPSPSHAVLDRDASPPVQQNNTIQNSSSPERWQRTSPRREASNYSDFQKQNSPPQNEIKICCETTMPIEARNSPIKHSPRRADLNHQPSPNLQNVNIQPSTTPEEQHPTGPQRQQTTSIRLDFNQDKVIQNVAGFSPKRLSRALLLKTESSPSLDHQQTLCVGIQSSSKTPEKLLVDTCPKRRQTSIRLDFNQETSSSPRSKSMQCEVAPPSTTASKSPEKDSPPSSSKSLKSGAAREDSSQATSSPYPRKMIKLIVTPEKVSISTACSKQEDSLIHLNNPETTKVSPPTRLGRSLSLSPKK